MSSSIDENLASFYLKSISTLNSKNGPNGVQFVIFPKVWPEQRAEAKVAGSEEEWRHVLGWN
jgi:hypothetical protein